MRIKSFIFCSITLIFGFDSLFNCNPFSCFFTNRSRGVKSNKVHSLYYDPFFQEIKNFTVNDCSRIVCELEFSIRNYNLYIQDQIQYLIDHLYEDGSLSQLSQRNNVLSTMGALDSKIRDSFEGGAKEFCKSFNEQDNRSIFKMMALIKDGLKQVQFCQVKAYNDCSSISIPKINSINLCKILNSTLCFIIRIFETTPIKLFRKNVFKIRNICLHNVTEIDAISSKDWIVTPKYYCMRLMKQIENNDYKDYIFDAFINILFSKIKKDYCRTGDYCDKPFLLYFDADEDPLLFGALKENLMLFQEKFIEREDFIFNEQSLTPCLDEKLGYYFPYQRFV